MSFFKIKYSCNKNLYLRVFYLWMEFHFEEVFYGSSMLRPKVLVICVYGGICDSGNSSLP